MDLEEHIREIRLGIEARQFAHEAAVAQGIVLRLLGALSWPCWNTHVVALQYSIQGRRADFALCHPADRPIALIEVKQLGMSSPASERQLFEYAFHAGVPLVVLTDGQQWDFFLPAEQGDYGERRVYKLDLLEREVDECSSRLVRYFKYDAIVSGAAIEAAREDYRSVAQTRLIQAALPKAWRKLVEEKDDLLIDLIADQAATLCGYKPGVETVAHFLKESITFTEQPSSARPRPVESSGSAATPASSSGSEPEYIRTYREMLKSPESLPSRMKKYIDEVGSLSWADLKKACVQRLGCKTKTSGSIGASLRVLELDSHVRTTGRGERGFPRYDLRGRFPPMPRLWSNIGLQPTASSVRSYVAPAFGSG